MSSGNEVECDCRNCGHCVQRHLGTRSVYLTRVCLLHAVGVRPDQLQKTNSVPCGTMYDMRHGIMPRSWREVEDNTCDIDVYDTGWVVCKNCNTSWEDKPHIYMYCPYCGKRIACRWNRRA